MQVLSTWLKKPKVLNVSLVVFGLCLRLFHYLRDPSVWHDEAALIVNVLGKGFRELLGPLFLSEAGPPLFLWMERGATVVLGDSTFALRLMPFLASCLALLIMAWVAAQLLQPEAVPWAIMLFACSNRMLWHTCEAKPYAVEVFAASTLLALYCWTRRWSMKWQLAIFSVTAPLLIFVAYPGAFLCGGLLLALLPKIIETKCKGTWLGYFGLVMVTVVAFAILVMGPAKAQRCSAMESCWVDQFPHWDRPWTVPSWTFFSSLDVVRYLFEPSGHALAFIGFAGAIVFWRNGQRCLVTLLCVPAGLALLASYLGAYPWGGARVEVYTLPAIALLVAAGVAPISNWLGRRIRFAPILLLPVLLSPLALTVYRVAVPWPRADCLHAANYVMSHRQSSDSITANHWEYRYYFRKLGQAFTPLEDWQRSSELRLWVVLTGQPMADRDIAAHFPITDWQIIDRRDFERTTVYLVTRRDNKTRLANDNQVPAGTDLWTRRAIKAAT